MRPVPPLPEDERDRLENWAAAAEGIGFAASMVILFVGAVASFIILAWLNPPR